MEYSKEQQQMIRQMKNSELYPIIRKLLLVYVNASIFKYRTDKIHIIQTIMNRDLKSLGSNKELLIDRISYWEHHQA